MKKLFTEAEVEFTLLSALEDVMNASASGSDLGDGSEFDEWK